MTPPTPSRRLKKNRFRKSLKTMPSTPESALSSKSGDAYCCVVARPREPAGLQ